MKHPLVLWRYVVIALVLAAASPGPIDSRAASAVDNSIYADLLQKYVHRGQVDYDGFKKEEDRLDAYLKILESIDPDKLSRSDQFAFYANAYNAWTIKLILTGYPGIDSIKELGSLFKSPWKKEIVRIDGDVITLDNVEHDILRPRFKDPRVHFAINCAAYSCPPLQSVPFEGSRLDAQLDEVTRAFINDPRRTYLKGQTLYVSRIFKWFGEDFNDDPYRFAVQYAEGDFKKQLQSIKETVEVEYQDYDWSLNNRPFEG